MTVFSVFASIKFHSIVIKDSNTAINDYVLAGSFDHHAPADALQSIGSHVLWHHIQDIMYRYNRTTNVNAYALVLSGVAPPAGSALGTLTLSPATITANSPYMGLLTGRTLGSTLSLTGAGAAGLSVNSVTGQIVGTPTTVGLVNVIETLTGATNTPKTNAALLSVTAAAPSVPHAFSASDWSITDPKTNGILRVTINVIPDNGGSAISDIEYQVNSGAWASSGIHATGGFNITGLTNGTIVSVKLRAVNSAGSGTASTPKASAPSDSITLTNKTGSIRLTNKTGSLTLSKKAA